MRRLLGFAALIMTGGIMVGCINITAPVQMPELPPGLECYQDSLGTWHCKQPEPEKGGDES